MTDKNYNQKVGIFSFLRLLLLTLIVFCCLFIGHHCLRVFYYRIVKTNSGLTYRIITNRSLVGQPLTMPSNDEKNVYILYQQEISYKDEIIEHHADFTRRYRHNGGVVIAPHFMRLDNSSLNCIDGGIYELLNLCKGGFVLEAEVPAYTVLSEQDLIKHKIHDTISKVKVRIYPFALCSYDGISEELTKYNNWMLELQTQQRISNKEKIKDLLKKKYPKSTYIEIENGFIVKTNDVSEQEHINEGSTVSFDISISNITTGELIYTTLLADGIKDDRNINVKEYKPIVLKVGPDMYNYFKNLSSGGEYDMFTPLRPQFYGDKQLYLFKIKNLEVKDAGNNPLNNPEVSHEEHGDSNKVDNKEENNERLEDNNEAREDGEDNNEKQENSDRIDNGEENKAKEENSNDNSNDINNSENIDKEKDKNQ